MSRNRDGGSRGGHGGGDQDAAMAPFVPEGEAMPRIERRPVDDGVFGIGDDIGFHGDADDIEELERELVNLHDKGREEKGSLHPLYNDMKHHLMVEVRIKFIIPSFCRAE